MKSITYTREGNDILAHLLEADGSSILEPVKVASIDTDGNLKMAHGKAAEHKAAVVKFLEDSGEVEDDKPTADVVDSVTIGEGDPDYIGKVPAGTPASEVLKAAAAPLVDVATANSLPPMTAVSNEEIPPCPPEDPASGDKTPAVVAWWFKYKPEEAAARYAGRRFAAPEI